MNMFYNEKYIRGIQTGELAATDFVTKKVIKVKGTFYGSDDFEGYDQYWREKYTSHGVHMDEVPDNALMIGEVINYNNSRHQWFVPDDGEPEIISIKPEGQLIFYIAVKSDITDAYQVAVAGREMMDNLLKSSPYVLCRKTRFGPELQLFSVIGGNALEYYKKRIDRRI